MVLPPLVGTRITHLLNQLLRLLTIWNMEDTECAEKLCKNANLVLVSKRGVADSFEFRPQI